MDNAERTHQDVLEATAATESEMAPQPVPINVYETTANHSVSPNVATSGVTPLWSSLPGLHPLPTKPGVETTESTSEESFEYEDDEPESVRSNVTRT